MRNWLDEDLGCNDTPKQKTTCYSCGVELGDDEPMVVLDGDPFCHSCKQMLSEYEDDA